MENGEGLDPKFLALIADAEARVMRRVEQERRQDQRRIAQLEATVAKLSGPSADASMVAAIWTAATATTKDDGPAFVTADVRKWADQDPHLDDAISAVLGPRWTPRKLGKALSRLWGVVGDMRVVQLSRSDRDGAVWVIRRKGV